MAYRKLSLKFYRKIFINFFFMLGKLLAAKNLLCQVKGHLRNLIMKVFIIGGTGAVGTHAVNSLERAGHDLIVLARKPEKAERLKARGKHVSNASIFDRSALAEAFSGCDAVVNLSSSIPPMSKFMLNGAWKANTKVRVEGSAAISAAATDAGVKRLLQESVSMLYPDSGNHWVDETTPVDKYPMAEANLAAEENAKRFTETGGVGVVLRFGWFYGPGATHSEQFMKMARYHLCVQMGKPNTYVSSIFTPDAGEAVAAALKVPAGIYNIVDNVPLTKREYANALGSAADVKWWIRTPGRAALLLGDRSTSLTRSIRASNEKFKRMSNWKPAFPSAREGWKQLAQSLS